MNLKPIILAVTILTGASTARSAFRAPAVPLVTVDPYTSCWSMSDNLYDDVTRHWTGTQFPLIGVINVDGTDYRFMGKEVPNLSMLVPTADGEAWTGRYATSKPAADWYEPGFDASAWKSDKGAFGSVPQEHLANTLWNTEEIWVRRDVNVPSGIGNKPVYLNYSHDDDVIIYINGIKVVDTGNQCHKGVRHLLEGEARKSLRPGKNLIAAWCRDRGGLAKTSRKAFHNGKKPGKPVSVHEVGMTVNMGKTRKASGYLMAGYDDQYSIQYFGTNLRPYWNRNNDSDIMKQMHLAADEYSSLMARSAKFDKDLINEATAAGGSEYADLCALAYRQAIAAHKLVETPEGEIDWFSKENFSNGSIGTVDITYPSAPMFLVYNPELVKGMMNHIFYYSESGKWSKPFAAHDVGTYPLANGQTYGGDMPVEESGNMLILCAALAKVEGNADYAAKHWNVLSTWAKYLTQYGLDPENQLCTDDFAGHFAHNANLSIKAILAVASYAQLADMLGKKNIAAEYFGKARAMAAEWEKMADDGDHYRLTFDKPGTWSQKYNLVWDKLLGLNIFPDKIMEKEIPYYLKKQNKYGLPLDNRETYTKTDWIMWTATMAPDKATFQKFVAPVHEFMNDTRNRVPMSDWIYTDRADQRGFQARSVVGGYYIKMLENRLKKH